MRREIDWTLKDLLIVHRALTSSSAVRTAGRVAKTRKVLAFLGSSIERVMDILARVQFLEGLFIGRGKESRYPSRRRPPRDALKVMRQMLEKEGASPAILETWLSPQNTRFIRDVVAPLEAKYAGTPTVDVDDVMSAIMSGMTLGGEESKSGALFTRLGVRMSRIEGFKEALLAGDKRLKPVARVASKWAGRWMLNAIKSHQSETRALGTTVDTGPKDEEEWGGGEASSSEVDTENLREDQVFTDMVMGEDPAALEALDALQGVIRTKNNFNVEKNPLNRGITRMLLEVMASPSQEAFKTEGDAYNLVAQRAKTELGIDITPMQVARIKSKVFSQELIPAMAAARSMVSVLEDGLKSYKRTLRELSSPIEGDDSWLKMSALVEATKDMFLNKDRAKDLHAWVELRNVIDAKGKYPAAFALYTALRMVNEDMVFEDFDELVDAVATEIGKDWGFVNDHLTNVLEEAVKELAPLAKKVGKLHDRIRIKSELGFRRVHSSKSQRGKTASVSREAQVAFDRELKPYLREFVSQAQRQILDVISDIMDGKWPKPQLQQMVMRHKPLSMTDEDFVEELVDAYSDWITKVKVGS